MALVAANNTWSFLPVVSAFPQTVFPNVALWNATNGVDLQYQIQLSWPLDWSSPGEANGTALTMFVLDGNALGMTATEAWRRRDAVELDQPNAITVSIGYPLTDSVYGAQRSIDFQPVTPGEDPPALPGVRQGSDDFITFIEGTLRPFVRSEFPNVEFGREAIYGHSFGGLFVVYTLLRRPDLFDTFLAASPDLTWNDNYILNHLGWLDEVGFPENTTKPAFKLSYGSLEQFPQQRRTESYQEFLSRVSLLRSYGVTFTMGDDCSSVFQYARRNPNLRDAELREYIGSDHASVGAVALADGIDYFVDW